MKLLKLELPKGYKMLQSGFEISFLTKTRISSSLPNADLLYLDEGLPYPIETFLVGKNSSGKSTVLEAISLALSLMSQGRIKASGFDYGDTFDVRITFYEKPYIYKYEGSFTRSNIVGNEFMEIVSENLGRAEMKDYYKKICLMSPSVKLPISKRASEAIPLKSRAWRRGRNSAFSSPLRIIGMRMGSENSFRSSNRLSITRLS